jgi:hypothetical protein
MTLFQLITFPIALALGLRSAFRLLRGERHEAARLR